MDQLSPYFSRRATQGEKETIDLRQFSAAEDQNHSLRDYWLIIKRHRWLVLICTLTIAISVALYTFTRIPLYTAEATLLIERKAPQFLKVQDARADSIDYADSEFYKTQYEILKSRALAERVIREEGLETDPLFTGDKSDQTSKGGLVANLWNSTKRWTTGFLTAKPNRTAPDAAATRTGLVGGYLSMLEIRPVTGTSLVQIKFTTADPAFSARLANAHAFAYGRYGIDLRSQTNEEAAAFLQQKLTELKERVQQSEAALNSYRRDKGIISVDDKQNVVVDRLLDLNKTLTAAEADRITLEAQVQTIRGRNSDELPAVLSSQVISVLKGELGRFEAEYASLSKEFKPGYPPLDSLKARIEETRRRLSTEVQNQVKGIEAPYLAAKAKEAELRARMDEQKRLTLNLKDSAVQYAILAREVNMNRQLYDGVLQRLKEIGVAAEVRASNNYVMGKAQPPLVPSYPNKQRSLLFGLFMGLAGGMGLAFLLERLDNTLKSPEEAERYIRLPSLAMVPDFALLNGTHNGTRGGYVSRLMSSAKAELPVWAPKRSKNPDGQLVLDHHPLSLVTEAYRALRSSLLLSQAGGAPQAMLMTSAGLGEGKTVSIVNTAIVFSQMGVRVLIIDADLRRPRCHTCLKVENGVGLTEILAGQIEWQKAINPTSADNLFLISSGALPPNPAELLGSEKMHDLLQLLRNHYQFIFVDSSPVLAVTDAVLMSTMVDGTLLVVDRSTPKPLLRKALARLRTPHSKILGTLLNRVDIRRGEYGGYYHQYYEYCRGDTTVPGSAAASVKSNGRFLQRLRVSRPATSEPPVEQAPHNEPPPAFLELMSARLFEAMGPMAPLVLRDHILALGESPDSFPEARLEELAKRVSLEISNDYQRLRFEEEMRLGVSRPATAEPPVKKVPDEPPSVFLERVVTKLSEAMGEPPGNC